MFGRTVIFLSLFFLAAPAAADEPFALTPSGATEAFFDMSVVETSDHVANSCLDFGWTMISSTSTMVICEVPLPVGQNILSALAAPKYATPAREYLRFNLTALNGYSRIQASGWRETQTAFGQTQRTDLQTENYHNNVMGFFIVIGGLYPPGTEFPNHAAMNIDYEFVTEPRKGLIIADLDSDGAFASAGLQKGDIVTRIARERIKNNNDVSDGLHKATKSESFDLEFYRGNQKMDVAVAVSFRPTAGPLPEPIAAEPEPAVVATTIIQSEISVADELAKLASLRDAGILSEEEFVDQKTKLLER